IVLRSPDLYVDWERDKPHEIRWEAFDNATEAAVRIDLLHDGEHGPAVIATIAATTPDDGSFLWTPANNNIDYGTFGLRIQVSLVGQPLVVDRGTEPFAVPENTTTFYVNDGSSANDEFTSGFGSNRNTGKTPAAPKPSPVNLLRAYTLGPTHTLFVDQCDYSLHAPIVLSGGGTRGDDEGFTLTGPADPSRETTFRYAHPSITGPMIELDDADSMTVRHLNLIGGSTGLQVGKDSTNLVADDLVIRSQTDDGVRIEGGSTGATLDHLEVTGNGGRGIAVFNQISRIADSLISNNQGDGMWLEQPRSVVLEANVVRQNAGRGISIDDNSGTTSRVGNADLSLGRGNVVANNAGNGIEAFGPINVAGNVVSGHVGSDTAGIFLSEAAARRNIVTGNAIGILNTSFDGAVSENRVYGNTIGIGDTGSNSTLERNVVYSNVTGIQTGGVYFYNSGFEGTIRNNVIYANSSAAIVLHDADPGATLANNTIYQTAGNGVVVSDYSEGVTLRDNIVWVEQGVGISVAADSQIDFTSDFNLLHATGVGRVGRWQNSDRASLAAWRNASGNDLSSVAGDPLFVDADGADGILGALGAGDGSDDDFHIQSVSGSSHGGSFAPVLSATSGLPIFLMGSYTSDAATSPALDRGDGNSPFANETAPNGGFVNLGAFGKSEQSSKSPASYVTLLSPNGGETWPIERNVTIRWRSHDAFGTVDLELVQDPAGSAEVVASIAADTANDGAFSWTVPNSISPGEYAVRITRGDATADFTSQP
ncbi:MAG: right-handed parallel beta-helix repeat-containing protein, partial [Planctomycetales bacterium]|nr:right-handed parallel beta-helix repeat-containing protein [Planctomycetales bacterium]